MIKGDFPYWANYFLIKCIKTDFLEEIFGDLKELYTLRKAERSAIYSFFWLVIQLLLLLKRPLLKPVYNNQIFHITMVKTHLKIGIRSLWKFKGYTFINLFGLSFGAAAAIILFLAAEFENSYDLFLPEKDQIYRVGENSPEIGDYYQTRTPLAPEFKNSFPEVIAASRYFQDRGWFEANHKSLQTNAFLVDTDFSEIFQYEVIAGNFKEALTGKGKIVLTASTAKKYFGYESAIGKTITKYPGKTTFKVTAVIADPPVNSSMGFEALLGWENGPKFLDINNAGNWYNTFMDAYVKLEKNADPQTLLAKTAPLIQEHFLPENSTSTLVLLPLEKWHSVASDNGLLINLLMIIAIIILLIAGFNFINLNTAQLLIRIKEIGIRKVMGSSKLQIITQFIMESLIVVLSSLMVALILVYFSFSWIDTLFDMQLEQVWITNKTILPVILISTLLYGTLTSMLPALIISKAPIIESMKGSLKKGRSKNLIQKGLIIVQFAASIFLISGTYIIWQQIDFMKSADLNFDKNNTFIVNSYEGDFKTTKNHKNVLLNLKNKLNNHSQVASACYAYNVPGSYWEDYNSFLDPEFPDRTVRLRQASVDPDYFKTLKIEFLEGGNLENLNNSSKEISHVVLNESAMKALGWKTLENKVLREDSDSRNIKILGVTKDFHYQGLDGKIEPLIHWVYDSIVNNMLVVRLNSKENMAANPQDVLNIIEKDWKKLNALSPFNYEFLGDQFNSQYEQQERIGYLAGFFSIIAFIIASLGLFSLSTFIIRRRKKEIGIRKVLGASTQQLVILLSKNFMLLVVMALVISIPVVFSSADKFLDGFAFRTEIGWHIFAAVTLFSLLVASVSVSFQAIKTSNSNPVNEIKDE